MELKAWEYDEFPAFDEDVPGATWLATTGDEVGARYLPDVEYQSVGGVPRVLQVLVPMSRNHMPPRAGGAPSRRYSCVVYVQGSAWMAQNVYANLPCVARLADRGYVVAIVQYRESGVGVFPDPVRDARNATRFMHGTKDRTVNTKCSVLLHEHLVATGHDGTLYLLEGADHGGPEFWSPQVLDFVDEFISRHTRP